MKGIRRDPNDLSRHQYQLSIYIFHLGLMPTLARTPALASLPPKALMMHILTGRYTSLTKYHLEEVEEVGIEKVGGAIPVKIVGE